MKRVLKKNYLHATVFASFVALFFLALQNCSGSGALNSTSGASATVPIAIPVNVEADATYQSSEESTGLNLLATATNLYAGFTGCTSGNTQVTGLISSTINLYKGDRNCLVKLTQFTLGSTTYTTGGVNAVNFTTWLAGDIATFQSQTSASDIIKVFVSTQVTASGVLTSDTVSYKFTDLASFTTQSLTTATVAPGVSLTVQGAASPDFTVAQARFVSVNANGSGNLSFTMHCGANVTGTGPNYSCSSVPMPTQIDYIFIPDAYSQGAITIQQANAAFVSNSATAVGTSTVGVGQQDPNSVTLARGGFYTGNLVTGTTPFSPSNLNYVLMLRRTDASSNGMSYIYYYVTLSATHSTTVAGCSTTFSSGAGTVGDPFIVSNRATLANTANCGSSVYFLQANDIDLGGSGNPWTPINLSAQYNGGNHKITGLYRNTTANAGLFATINSGASVSNLILQSVDLTVTNGTAGALAVNLNSATVTNCSSSGTITGTSGGPILGGLIGSPAPSASVISSSSSVSIVGNSTGTGFGGYYGGLMGLGLGSGTITVSNSYTNGSITLTNTNAGNTGTSVSMGGILAGTIGPSLALSNSYTTQTMTITPSSVFGLVNWGGIVGGMSNASTFTGLFSAATMTSTSNSVQAFAGGMIGRVQINAMTFSNSYTMTTIAGSTNGSNNIGGFFGRVDNGATISVSSSYSASPSLSGSGTISGFYGGTGLSIPTTSYLYDNAGVPSQTITNLVVYTSTTDMQDQTKFDVANGGGFTFGTGTNNWKMPSANPFATSPYASYSPALLSPVQYWQCGSNGIVCP